MSASSRKGPQNGKEPRPGRRSPNKLSAKSPADYDEEAEARECAELRNEFINAVGTKHFGVLFRLTYLRAMLGHAPSARLFLEILCGEPEPAENLDLAEPEPTPASPKSFFSSGLFAHLKPDDFSC